MNESIRRSKKILLLRILALVLALYGFLASIFEIAMLNFSLLWVFNVICLLINIYLLSYNTPLLKRDWLIYKLYKSANNDY